jgi:hypothetical protein
MELGPMNPRFTGRPGATTSMRWPSCSSLGADMNQRADLEGENEGHLKGPPRMMIAAQSIDGASVKPLRWFVDREAATSATLGADPRGEESHPLAPPNEMTR